MHQQRFAAAGGHPERQLVQLRPRFDRFIEWRDLIRIVLVFVVLRDLRIDTAAQPFRIAKILIQIDFSEQQRKVLKILPHQTFFAARDSWFVQGKRVANNVLIVFQQRFCCHLCQVEQLFGQRVVEPVDVVYVQPLECLVLQVLRQLF